MNDPAGPSNDPLQRASVTVLINGDNLIPGEVTALLGPQPELGVRKGETFVMHGGRQRVAHTGMWHVGTGLREPPCIDEQIVDLLGSLSGDLNVWQDLVARFDCLVAVGLWFDDDSWTGGFTLQPQSLRLLGERGLPIDFDMYAPAASE